jgi:hypothetical protein
MNMTKLLAIATCLMGSSAGLFAQETATATATATIVTPITIAQASNLSFGNVSVSSTTAGTVVLAPAGTRTATNGVTLPATAGTVEAASFTVEGESGYTYAITLPSSDVTLSSASETMTANSFTSTPSSTGTLTDGSQTIRVGATLNVSAAQAAGTYTTETPFEVSVIYN